MEFIFQFLLVILLVLLNGYFVAAEFALVGVRKTRINELANKGNSAAKLVKQALDHLDSYISATQLGITLASLGLGWIGEPTLAHYIEPIFNIYLGSETAFITAHTLAVVIAFSLITFLHIVLGELAPKTIALQRAEATSLFLIIPLVAFTTIFKPFIWVLNGAGNSVVRSFGLRPPRGHELVHSEEEIKMILNQSQMSGIIPKGEAEMVQNIFKLGDTSINKIMTPKSRMIAFDVNILLTDLLEKASKNIHSRFPVFKGSINNIIGFIHVKDLYQQAVDPVGEEAFEEENKKKLSELDIIRDIIFVPPSQKADRVLLEMRKKRVHMAIVRAGNKTEGLVTLEDVVEDVVGEIQDEFEKP